MERGEIMIFEKLKTSIKEQRENERLKATVQEQAALLEYVATMADIDLPTLADDTENMESEAAEKAITGDDYAEKEDDAEA